MSFEKIILIGVFVLIVIIGIFMISGFFGNGSHVQDINVASVKNVQAKEVSVAKPGFKTVSTGTTGSGDVSIDLTPQEIEDDKLKVKISVNTHSVSLSQFDLKEITTLESEENIQKPLSAPSMKGHHVSGELVFPIGKNINTFTIKIKSIPKVEERIFEWKNIK